VEVEQDGCHPERAETERSRIWELRCPNTH
jgi:hypothetical protein